MQRVILGRVRTTLYRRSGNTKRDKVAMDFSFLAGALEKKKKDFSTFYPNSGGFFPFFIAHTAHKVRERKKIAKEARLFEFHSVFGSILGSSGRCTHRHFSNGTAKMCNLRLCATPENLSQYISRRLRRLLEHI